MSSGTPQTQKKTQDSVHVTKVDYLNVNLLPRLSVFDKAFKITRLGKLEFNHVGWIFGNPTRDKKCSWNLTEHFERREGKSQ